MISVAKLTKLAKRSADGRKCFLSKFCTDVIAKENLDFALDEPQYPRKYLKLELMTYLIPAIYNPDP